MNTQSMTRVELEAEKSKAEGRIAAIDTSLDAVKAEFEAQLRPMHAERQQWATQLGQLTSELAKRKARDAIVPTVSDHALLRYMERAHGIDVDALKADLLEKGLANAILQGATGMQTDAGTFVIVGSTATTFLGKEMRPKRKTQRGLTEAAADFDEEDAA